MRGEGVNGVIRRERGGKLGTREWGGKLGIRDLEQGRFILRENS